MAKKKKRFVCFRARETNFFIFFFPTSLFRETVITITYFLCVSLNGFFQN